MGLMSWTAHGWFRRLSKIKDNLDKELTDFLQNVNMASLEEFYTLNTLYIYSTKTTNCI